MDFPINISRLFFCLVSLILLVPNSDQTTFLLFSGKADFCGDKKRIHLFFMCGTWDRLSILGWPESRPGNGVPFALEGTKQWKPEKKPPVVWVTPKQAHRTAGSGSGQNDSACGTCPLPRVKRPRAKGWYFTGLTKKKNKNMSFTLSFPKSAFSAL